MYITFISLFQNNKHFAFEFIGFVVILQALVAFAYALVTLAIRLLSPSVQLLPADFVRYIPNMLITLNRLADENQWNENRFGFHIEHDVSCERMLISVLCISLYYKVILVSNWKKEKLVNEWEPTLENLKIQCVPFANFNAQMFSCGGCKFDIALHYHWIMTSQFNFELFIQFIVFLFCWYIFCFHIRSGFHTVETGWLHGVCDIWPNRW